jgi:hypothetical protein
MAMRMDFRREKKGMYQAAVARANVGIMTELPISMQFSGTSAFLNFALLFL